MIKELIQLISEQKETHIIVSLEAYEFFKNTKEPLTDKTVALLSFSDSELPFLEKLAGAIQQHLKPAGVFKAEGLDWDAFLNSPSLKWIITAKKDLPFLGNIPIIPIYAPTYYEANPEAKRTLWKMLCQTLAQS